MSVELDDKLLSNYKFDYSQAKPNRFVESERAVVVLDEELSKVFTTSESVNKALKALLDAIPEKTT